MVAARIGCARRESSVTAVAAAISQPTAVAAGVAPTVAASLIEDAVAVLTATPASICSAEAVQVVVMNARRVLFLEAVATASEEDAEVSVDFFFLC